MTVTHIFFGGIGTLVETSELQFEAFNHALTANRVDFQWSREAYIDSLSGSGGQNRLATITLKNGDVLSADTIAKVHADKTKIYADTMRKKGLTLRAGANDLIHKAKENGIKLVWATTTEQTNIDAFFDAVGSTLKKDMFVKVTNKQYITHQKPDPEVYTKLLNELGITADQVLVIEDSQSGVTSSSNAGITTLAFPGEMTSGKDFLGSKQQITSLKDVIG